MYINRNKLQEIKKKLKSSGLEYWTGIGALDEVDWNWSTGSGRQYFLAYTCHFYPRLFPKCENSNSYIKETQTCTNLYIYI